MTKRNRHILWFVAALAIGVAFLAFSARPRPVKVVVAKVEKGNIEETVANTRAGTVKSCRRAQMSPAMGGQIAALPVKEGDRVKQGELLLSLWNDDLKAGLLLARSEAVAAKERAKSVCVQASNAKVNEKRLRSLYKTHAVSRENLDDAVARARSAEADCDSAKASAKVSEEQVGVARANVTRSELFAPFDGVIVEVNGEVGEYVTPSPPGIPTLPAVDMVDASCYYVTAPIDEVDAPKIKTGMPARISLDAFRERRFPAHVKRIANYVLDREKQARTVDIEVSFDKPQDMQLMLPGYSADAEVILKTRDNVLRVPTEAVVDKRYLFVLNDSDELEKREVRIGLSNWDHTEILEGVELGETVVTSVDRSGVVDGARAKVEAVEAADQ